MREHRPRLICLGLSAFDVVWSVPTLPSGGGKIRAQAFREGGGGMAANAAVAAARLGAIASFWGRAGNDRAGMAMREALAAESVDVSHFRCFDGATSSVSGILVDEKGERSIVNFRGEGLPGSPDWLPLDEVRNAAAVLADPRWPEGAAALFGAARRWQVPTVLDGDVADAEVFDALLPLVDHAIFSAPGLAGYAASTAGPSIEAQLRFALERGCRLAAVTLGEEGVAWTASAAAAAAVHRVSALPVEVVDTTGAGDVFHGGYAYAIGAGLAVGDAFEFANAVAALKCRHAGGRGGSPDLNEILLTLQRLKDTR